MIISILDSRWHWTRWLIALIHVEMARERGRSDGGREGR